MSPGLASVSLTNLNLSYHVDDTVVGRTQSYFYTNILNVLRTNGGLRHCLCELRTHSG